MKYMTAATDDGPAVCAYVDSHKHMRTPAGLLVNLLPKTTSTKQVAIKTQTRPLRQDF